MTDSAITSRLDAGAIPTTPFRSKTLAVGVSEFAREEGCLAALGMTNGEPVLCCTDLHLLRGADDVDDRTTFAGADEVFRRPWGAKPRIVGRRYDESGVEDFDTSTA